MLPSSLPLEKKRVVGIDTVNTKAKQYQECNTLVTRIKVRILRIKDKDKGALQVASNPHVPNNNTGIILSIIPAYR